MATEDLHEGNGGSILHATFKKRAAAFSLVGCTELIVIMKKKTGEVLIKDAEYEPAPVGVGDGSDGKIRYVFTTEDLDSSGEWKVQGFARFNATTQVYTSIVSMTVAANLATIP